MGLQRSIWKALGILLLAARAHSAEPNAAAERFVLDDFERSQFGSWTWSGPGKLSLAEGHAPGVRGNRVLRVDTTVELRNAQTWWGELRCKPKVTDWRPYQAVSVWVRAGGTRRIHSLALYAENRGTRLESHHVILPAGQWTKVVFPLAEFNRERVDVFFFSHTAGGALPGEGTEAVYEFDDLALEPGPSPKLRGWDVAPGLAAFAHCGYRSDEPKQVLFPPGTEGPAVVYGADGERICSVAMVDDAPGNGPKNATVNRVADLTRLTKAGQYYVAAGTVRSETFPIGPEATLTPVRAVLRFLYLMRCGSEVVDQRVGHGPCHLDNCRTQFQDDVAKWPLGQTHLESLGPHMDLVGGWHDAGIIDQYVGNTGIITYALALVSQSYPELAEAAEAEAIWGGRWLVKATLPTGEFLGDTAGNARWTDNRVGTPDDRPVDVRGAWPDHGMKAVCGMARLAARLAGREPQLREDLLAAVRRAVRHYRVDRFPGYTISQYLFSSWGALAGLEAAAATGDAEAKQFGRECLQNMLRCQDAEAGFFYSDTLRKTPMRDCYGQGIGILALARACQLAPEDPQAPSWKAAVERWCDRYAVPMMRYAGAYHVFAFGIYGHQEDDAYHGKESWWGSPYDTKVFAPWPASDSALQFRAWRVRVLGAYGATGQCGTNRYLSMHAAALYSASRLLGRSDLRSLADEQLQWIAGRNPWSQCMITGFGRRNPVPYQTMIGDIFGSMYQGIGSQDGDAPYFSPYCFYSQREIWGVCGGLYLMAAAMRAR